MDLLKSSSFFTAGDLLRSPIADGIASKRITDRLSEGEQQADHRDTIHAFAGLPFESIDVPHQGGALADQSEALILLHVWQGEAADHRHLMPSMPVPSLASGLALLEARNCLSNYVLSAF